MPRPREARAAVLPHDGGVASPSCRGAAATSSFGHAASASSSSSRSAVRSSSSSAVRRAAPLPLVPRPCVSRTKRSRQGPVAIRTQPSLPGKVSPTKKATASSLSHARAPCVGAGPALAGAAAAAPRARCRGACELAVPSWLHGSCRVGPRRPNGPCQRHRHSLLGQGGRSDEAAVVDRA